MAGGPGVGRRQPEMQRHQPGLEAEADQGQDQDEAVQGRGGSGLPADQA